MKKIAMVFLALGLAGCFEPVRTKEDEVEALQKANAILKEQIVSISKRFATGDLPGQDYANKVEKLMEQHEANLEGIAHATAERAGFKWGLIFFIAGILANFILRGVPDRGMSRFLKNLLDAAKEIREKKKPPHGGSKS